MVFFHKSDVCELNRGRQMPALNAVLSEKQISKVQVYWQHVTVRLTVLRGGPSEFGVHAFQQWTQRSGKCSRKYLPFAALEVLRHKDFLPNSFGESAAQL